MTQTSTAFAPGNRPIGVPVVSGTLTAEWDTPLPGLTLIGTAAYNSDSYVNLPNTQSIPAWTRFDLGASYRTSLDKTPLMFRATVQNVFNNNYWSGVTGFGALLEAAPRTVLLSIAADF